MLRQVHGGRYEPIKVYFLVDGFFTVCMVRIFFRKSAHFLCPHPLKSAQLAEPHKRRAATIVKLLWLLPAGYREPASVMREEKSAPDTANLRWPAAAAAPEQPRASSRAIRRLAYGATSAAIRAMGNTYLLPLVIGGTMHRQLTQVIADARGAGGGLLSQLLADPTAAMRPLLRRFCLV